MKVSARFWGFAASLLGVGGWLLYYCSLAESCPWNAEKNEAICVVGIFKNEAMGIREWCQHYFDEGIDQIFLIDNNSTDDYKSQISQFGNKVVVVKDSKRHAQDELYNRHFLKKAKTFDWVIVVDLDEFLYSRSPWPTIKAYLANAPKKIGKITLLWKMFGSNKHDRQPASIVKGFTKRQEFGPIQYNGKSITRGSALIRISVHWAQARGRILKLEANDRSLNLNHYAIQSKEYFEKVKMRRGDVLSERSENVRHWKYFRSYDWNEVDDYELAEKKGYDVGYYRRREVANIASW